MGVVVVLGNDGQMLSKRGDVLDSGISGVGEGKRERNVASVKLLGVGDDDLCELLLAVVGVEARRKQLPCVSLVLF